MNKEKHSEIIRQLSDRIVTAQAPIRILDAIKWDDSVQQAFFAHGGRCQPEVNAAYYDRNPLKYDINALRKTFREIEADVVAKLGQSEAAGNIMCRMCREYRRVLDMLAARGTPAFAEIARELYGSSIDVFHVGGPTVADLGMLLDGSLRNIGEGVFLEKNPKDIPTRAAVTLLQQWLDRVFTDPAARVRVMESDGIVADAAAGSDYIKLRANTCFSERDLRALEAHEGWVHVGTTLNGSLQPTCTFLSKGTPADTITQEGLAVFIEVVSFNSHPARLRRIADRIRAIHLAEQGATFLDIFTLLRDEGRSAEEAYSATVRIFRGSTPEEGPFTKDLAYSKGFVLVYNFFRLAVRRGRLDRIPLLFCGKLAIEDMGTLAQLAEAGLVKSPKYLPPPLVDLNALTAWMAYSNFLNQIDLIQIDADFAPILD
ncbi:flavohemoglobin expression-modulating QEGLA motif protein [Nitrosococcus wardiae]|uniref:Flavohemoglobin expression-modulating QEGLA motif protein n=1 Tax=Nitrosococcus wardiae TaxID=1814290 RepID=A0A4P7BVM6_9GAMM|nr:flavohemoglobin expression-modulating QEGLA motif protein [Nitrosococcus wardiae]QBQ53961.1 flavohemoglobin expression-modulating QEGLA motif protein [Nitrosococcus wardiae]